MTELEFNIAIDGDADPAALRAAADRVCESLAEEAAIQSPVAAPIAGARSLGAVAMAIGVTVSVVLDVTKGIDAILATIEKLRKSAKGSDSGSDGILAKIDPARVLIDVDGIMVPLTKLTAEHLKALAAP